MADAADGELGIKIRKAVRGIMVVTRYFLFCRSKRERRLDEGVGQAGLLRSAQAKTSAAPLIIRLLRASPLVLRAQPTDYQY